MKLESTKMKLKDNSGGIWTNIILKRMGAEASLRASASPSPELLNIVGHEMVNSIKGSFKRYVVVDTTNGIKVVVSKQKGSYQNGILKKSTPEGRAFKPLADSTIAIRRVYKNNTRGREFILRETSMRILKGLGILRLSRNYRQSAGVVVGWANPEDSEIALKQHNGFDAPNPILEYGDMDKVGRMLGSKKPPKPVTIPARPFIGYSKELQQNIYNIMLAWISGGKSA